MFGQRKPLPGMGPKPNAMGNPQGPPGYVAQASRPQGVGGVVESSTHTAMPTRPGFNPNVRQWVSRRDPTGQGSEQGVTPQLGSKGGDPRRAQGGGGQPGGPQPVQPGPPIDFLSAIGGAGSPYAGGVGPAGTMNRGWQMASTRNKGNGYGTT